MTSKFLRPLFVIAAVYDLVLGIAFTFMPLSIFRYFEVTPPDYLGYVQFPALLLLIFAAMFFRIASDPVRYRYLIWYGIGLKVAYSGVAFWHYFTSDLPWMWMPWAVFDIVFLVFFLAALVTTRNSRVAGATNTMERQT